MKSLLTSILILLLVVQAEATIARVRSTFATTGAVNGTSVTLDFNGANATSGGTPSAGNTLVVTVAGHLSSSVIVRGSEQAGVNWMAFQTANNPGVAILVGRVTSTIASSSVTINQSLSGTLCAIGAEYSGTNLRVDKNKSNFGASTNATTGTTETTSNANELWVGAIAIKSTNANTMSTAQNSFSFITCAGANMISTTNGTTNTDVTGAYLERIVTSAAGATTGATVSPTNTWNAVIVTLEETPSGGGQKSWIGWIQFFNWLKSGGLIKR